MSDCPWCVWEGAGEEVMGRGGKLPLCGETAWLVPAGLPWEGYSLKSHPFISEGGALKIWVPGVESDLVVFELKHPPTL